MLSSINIGNVNSIYDIENLFNKVIQNNEALLVNRPNNENVVIIPLSKYNILKDNLYVLSHNNSLSKDWLSDEEDKAWQNL